ncbi:DUF4328 domain-containing protein [Rhodococcus sp. NPDC058505]|uniref:DUF4328 domain-containing protein n=1 Tax=unclassified Rhodococcus (in: high G+C Gram-positive bacteria) TaxID=192944 RepID=UPI00364A4C3B
MLLSPTLTGHPEPASRRNFRWIARSPATAPRTPPNHTAGPDRTPSYPQPPRWGLTDQPPATAEEQATRTERLAELAPTLLTATALLFVFGAAAELFRYVLLLRNRTTLISPTMLVVSDGLVFTAGVMAPLVAFAAAAASVAWLLGARRDAWRAAGRTDPRSPTSIAAGCLIPVANLVWPGVFLTELAGPDSRLRALVRIWWATWALGGALLIVAFAWRSHDSLQGRANGVLLAVLVNLVAAAVATLTLIVTRHVDRLDLAGRPRSAVRWLVTT